MSKSVEICKDLYYIGVSDPELRTFDIIMKTANGTTYNAYLLKTQDGVIILDTVKKEFQDEFFDKLELYCDYKDIKYIVMHHLEPDHSGALPELTRRAPDAKILISPQATPMLKSIAQSDDMIFESVWTNKEITLGGKTLKFLSTPNLHWPETMSSYLIEDRVLFSGDVFGSHYYDTRLFDNLVGDFDYAFKYYYEHIMRPFKTDVLNALRLYDKLEIDIIANLHGPIMRSNPQKYLNLYRDWSSKDDKHHGKKVVSIFYVTSYKNTKDIAIAIFEGIESNDSLIANIYDLTALNESNMISILEDSTGIVIGSPTINGDVPKPVWDLLSCMMLIEKRGKFGACFGSYGWSGEAVEMINSRLKSLKFRVPLQPIKIKLIPTKEELLESYDFGREFGEVVNGKMMEMTL
ncbi:MAG TPA: FprA family A-type flavoprotein [Campylobacterales bacterium]|nr:FprA family A-type flavoprotein [Campylobacterales bacterium]HHD80862.1 FprA family A-type flavoprotein [Campylobacterales bacterium]HHH51090.1 FprA family A-type flavoprotein [Campylobacterales bacterium]